MFERFTDRARQVVVLAQHESVGLGHNYIGTEHLLLGVIAEGAGVGAQVIESFKVELDDARAAVVEQVGRGDEAPSDHIPFRPDAKRVLERSLRESLQLGHSHIGTEHVLLGLLNNEESVAAQVLMALGIDRVAARKRCLEQLATMPASPVAPQRFAGPSARTPSVDRTDRCGLCGRDLWEVERYVRGEWMAVCDECVAAAQARLEESTGEVRALNLPPRVFGPEVPDADTLNTIVHAFEVVFRRAETDLPRDRFVEGDQATLFSLDEHAAHTPHAGVAEVRVGRIRLTGETADVRFGLLFNGGYGYLFEGRATRGDDAWEISGETVRKVIAREGIFTRPPR